MKLSDENPIGKLMFRQSYRGIDDEPYTWYAVILRRHDYLSDFQKKRGEGQGWYDVLDLERMRKIQGILLGDEEIIWNS